MTCKDCIYYDMCNIYKTDPIMNNCYKTESYCLNFKDKSKFIELPCDIGDKLYKPWTCGGKRVVAEFIVTGIHYIAKNTWIIKYMKPLNFGRPTHRQSNLSDIGETIFLTKEEAINKNKEVK